MLNRTVLTFVAVVLFGCFAYDGQAKEPDRFRWESGAPVVSPIDGEGDTCYSVKDPSIVRYNGVNYLFMTIRSAKRTHQIEFLAFADWEKANGSKRTRLKIHPGFYCAPQVFYYTPQRKWYLICQVSDPGWKTEDSDGFRAAFATTENIADPDSWSPLQPMDVRPPRGAKKNPKWLGLDFWVICDEHKAFLFFTRDDGDMWRAETSLAAFPNGWSEPELALRGEIFEASHTCRIKGENRYVTIVEAVNKKAVKHVDGERGQRFYKAYVADRLDGTWTLLAGSKDNPFAELANVRFSGAPWSESISHGELLRSGYDEKMEVDFVNPVFLYQGVLDKDIPPGKYGEIPWRLGLLKRVK